jgi:hypothetical protein
VSYTSAIIDEDLANLRGLGELGGAGDYGPVIPQTGILIRRAEGPKNTGQQKKFAKKINWLVLIQEYDGPAGPNTKKTFLCSTATSRGFISSAEAIESRTARPPLSNSPSQDSAIPDAKA